METEAGMNAALMCVARRQKAQPRSQCVPPSANLLWLIGWFESLARRTGHLILKPG